MAHVGEIPTKGLSTLLPELTGKLPVPTESFEKERLGARRCHVFSRMFSFHLADAGTPECPAQRKEQDKSGGKSSQPSIKY